MKIELACQNVRYALVQWRKCSEKLPWEFGNNLSQAEVPNHIARLNRMHREISGIDDLMHPPMELTCSSDTDVSGHLGRCAGQYPPQFRSLASFQTSRRFAKQMTGYSKIEPPFSRIRSTCFFDDSNCEA